MSDVLFIGDELLLREVKHARCCATCDHAIMRGYHDDPISYGCTVESSPHEGVVVRALGFMSDQRWWNRNATRAGLTCPLHRFPGELPELKGLAAHRKELGIPEEDEGDDE